MAKIYAIASGKGGTGKTTTAINLGVALNDLGEDVIVVDTNWTTPNVGLHLGAPIVPVSLNHVLKGEASIGDAIYEHESGVKIIPCSLSLKDLKKINSDSLFEVAKQLKKISNYIIFDSAAGLGEEAVRSINASDEVIVVANPNILSVTDALKTIKTAENLNKRVKGVIITRTRGHETEMPLASIMDMLEKPILGIVPEDIAVHEALAKKNSVVFLKPRSSASLAYREIAEKLSGKEKKQESFYQKVLRAIGFR